MYSTKIYHSKYSASAVFLLIFTCFFPLTFFFFCLPNLLVMCLNPQHAFVKLICMKNSSSVMDSPKIRIEDRIDRILSCGIFNLVGKGAAEPRKI